MTHGTRAIWLYLIPLFLLTFWLGARGLNADSIWADELYSLRDAGGPFYGPLTPAQIWERVATGNPWHTPGFFILLNGWSHLVGWQPPALRALSLLLGILAIAWVYRLGAERLSPRAGLYAAAIVGTSAFYIHYLHEIRMYTLIVLLTTCTLWLYLRIVHTPRAVSRFAWIGLFAGAVGILYTHYLAALLLAVIGIYHLLFVPKNRRWWNVAAAMISAGLVFLPWVRVLVSGLNRTAEDVSTQARALGAGEILIQVGYLFSNGSLILLVGTGILFLMAGIRRDALLRVRRQRTPKRVSLLALITIMWLALILLANALLGIIPASRIRYLLALWTPLALLVGYGMDVLQRTRTRQALSLHNAGLGLLVLWMGLGVWRSGDSTLTADVRDSWFVFPMHTLTAAMRADSQPGDLIAAYLPDDTHPWVYYTTLDIANVYFNGFAANYRVSMTLPNAQERRDEMNLMSGLLDNRQRVWTASMPSKTSAALDVFTAALDDQAFALCRTPVDQPNLRISLYTQSPVCCDSDAALIRYPGGITLTGITPLPAEVKDTLPVLIGWSVSANVSPFTYSVALHILDEDGALVTQTDYGLPYYTLRCEPTALDVSTLLPGDYTLAVIVYAWETGARLPGTIVTTSEQGERLPLGTFTVK